MPEKNTDNSVNEQDILSEFQISDVDLVQALLNLRQAPPEELKQRIRTIPNTTTLNHPDSRIPGESKGRKTVRNWQSKLSPNSVRIAMGVAGLFVLALLFLATVPTARATVGQMLQRFGIVLISPNPDDTNILQSPTETVGVEQENLEVQEKEAVEVIVEQLSDEKMSFDEAQQLLSSDPPMPSWLPDDLILSGVRIGTGPSAGTDEAPLTVIVSYEPAPGSNYLESAGLGLQTTYATQLEGGYSFPLGKEQEVMIHEQPGIFIKGSWWRDDDKDNPLLELEWHDDSDAGHLTWNTEGLTFNLSASGLNLSLTEFIRIAESVQIQQ